MKGTLDFGLKFVASDKGNFSLQGFEDADWAGDISTRKSGVQIRRCHYLMEIKASTPLSLYLPQKLNKSLYALQLKRQFG